MKLSESEKQEITIIVEKITNEYRETFKVRIFTSHGVDGSLRLIMGDEYVKVGISYTVQEFENIGCYIIQHHPKDLALYFGIYWQNELKKLYSFYSIRLKQKAMKVLDDHLSTF